MRYSNVNIISMSALVKVGVTMGGSGTIKKEFPLEACITFENSLVLRNCNF